MDTWLWWLGSALVLGIAEMLTLHLVFLMFAGGALVGALSGALGAPFGVQIALGCVTSIALLAALRPWLLKRWRTRVPLVETNTAKLVGQVAVVVAPTSEAGGRVKLAGEVWSARADLGAVTNPPGTEVRVSRIDGATVVVRSVASGPAANLVKPAVDA